MDDEGRSPAPGGIGSHVEAALVARLHAERDRLAAGLTRIADLRQTLRSTLAERATPGTGPPPEVLGVVEVAAGFVVDVIDGLVDRPPPGLDTWVQRVATEAHVVLIGELDISTRSTLTPVLEALVTAPTDVVLHLHLLAFLDCAGVAPLIGLANALAATGRRVRARGASKNQRLVLELTPIAFE